MVLVQNLVAKIKIIIHKNKLKLSKNYFMKKKDKIISGNKII